MLLQHKLNRYLTPDNYYDYFKTIYEIIRLNYYQIIYTDYMEDINIHILADNTGFLIMYKSIKLEFEFTNFYNTDAEIRVRKAGKHDSWLSQKQGGFYAHLADNERIPKRDIEELIARLESIVIERSPADAPES